MRHPQYGKYRKAVFDYYPPSERLDFSDTGELLFILNYGELPVAAFQKQFLQ